MKRLLVICGVLAVWGALLVPVVSALEPPPPDYNGSSDAYRYWCATTSSFESGCVAPGGSWSPAYADFAAEYGIPEGLGGARAKWFPSRSRSMDEVLYVVGPYLPTANHATIEDEQEAIAQLAPAMRAVDHSMTARDVSTVYIGFGRPEHAHQPVAQRVAATKATIKAFEAERARTLGRTPESTAIVGLSLGGVVTKIALTELEAEGFDHGVDTYISFDAPHFGAYTPPSIQMVPAFFKGAFRWIERDVSWSEALYDNPFDDLRDTAGQVSRLALENPVSQDVLAINTAYDRWASPNIDYIRSRYRQLPAQSRNVAIASGSVTGQRPALGTNYFAVATGKSGNSLKAIMNITASSPRTDADHSFYGQMSYKAPVTTSLEFGKRVYYPKNPPLYAYPQWLIDDYERAPCAYSTGIVDLMVSQLNTQLSDSLWNGFSTEAAERRACFMPSFSATISNSTGPATGSSQFDRVIGDASNKAHMKTSGPMNQALLDELNLVFAKSVMELPANDLADIIQDSISNTCDFASGNHNLEETHAMFPAECGRPWNPETDRCDYGSDGWRCFEVGDETPIKFAAGDPDADSSGLGGYLESYPGYEQPGDPENDQQNDSLDNAAAAGALAALAGYTDGQEQADVDGGAAATSSDSVQDSGEVNYDADGSAEVGASQATESAAEVADESSGNVGEVEGDSGGDVSASANACDFHSGTHNLEETRAMFPEKCGQEWTPAVHTCDYDDNDGWHCYQFTG